MRDYLIGYEDGPMIPVAEVATPLLHQALQDIGENDQSECGQCSGRDLRDRIAIELRARELGL